MTPLIRIVAVLLLAAACSGAPLQAMQAQPPEQQDEFVPIDQLPPEDRISGVPLLIAAYAFVLVMFFAYMVSVSRRLGTVQREVERLESDMKRTGRA